MQEFGAILDCARKEIYMLVNGHCAIQQINGILTHNKHLTSLQKCGREINRINTKKHTETD